MTLGDRICVLNQGEIMQVDTPMNLYQYPANKFVAGFIGSPAMNLLKVRLDEIDGLMNVVSESGSRWALPQDKQVIAREKLGEWVWFGVRPEHIQLANHDAPLSEVNTQTHRLDVVESMGNELYLYFKLGVDKLVARVPFDADRSANSGEETVLHFNTSQCHLFDLETEETLDPKRCSCLSN